MLPDTALRAAFSIFGLPDTPTRIPKHRLGPVRFPPAAYTPPMLIVDIRTGAVSVNPESAYLKGGSLAWLK
jgi:hypothetical protein